MLYVKGSGLFWFYDPIYLNIEKEKKTHSPYQVLNYVEGISRCHITLFYLFIKNKNWAQAVCEKLEYTQRFTGLQSHLYRQ